MKWLSKYAINSVFKPFLIPLRFAKYIFYENCTIKKFLYHCCHQKEERNSSVLTYVQAHKRRKGNKMKKAEMEQMMNEMFARMCAYVDERIQTQAQVSHKGDAPKQELVEHTNRDGSKTLMPKGRHEYIERTKMSDKAYAQAQADKAKAIADYKERKQAYVERTPEEKAEYSKKYHEFYDKEWAKWQSAGKHTHDENVAKNKELQARWKKMNK